MALLSPAGEAPSRPVPSSQSVAATGTWSATGPKLRDSCHACAASKVKCNKVKPICARCAKRGTPCEYVTTKRAGRKRDSRPSTIDAVKASNTSQRPSPPAVSEPQSQLLSPGLIQLPPSGQQHAPAYSDILPNIPFQTDPLSSSTLTTANTDFDDFFASLASANLVGTPASDFLSHHDFSKDDGGGLFESNDGTTLQLSDDAFSLVDEAVSGFNMLSGPRSPPGSRASTTTTGDAQSLQSFQGLCSDSQCCCLMSALTLLKQLSPNASMTCTQSRRESLNSASGMHQQLPPLQSVVAENERSIEAISNMLQCSCSQDGYLLSIISLIVFKILGFYAQAVQQTTTEAIDDGQSSIRSHYSDMGGSSSVYSEQVLQSPLTPTAISGNYLVYGESQRRMAAQRVLGELHRVQRIINLLSQRLKGHGVYNDVAGTGTPISITDEQDPFPNPITSSPFSKTMLDQLETDLRKRLRALSLEIIELLRQG